jgi:hypothetical protein
MFDKLELILKFAELVAQCQSWNLITADERAVYFKTLNSKVYAEIERLLAMA